MTAVTWDAVRPFIEYSESPHYYLGGAFVWSTPPGGFLAAFTGGSLSQDDPTSQILTGIFPAKDAVSAEVAARVQLHVHYQDRDPVIATTVKFYGGTLNLQEFTTIADDMRGGWNPDPPAFTGTTSELLLFGGTQSLLVLSAVVYSDVPIRGQALPSGRDVVAWPFEEALALSADSNSLAAIRERYATRSEPPPQGKQPLDDSEQSKTTS
ncbi:hypothetical protein [Microbacterium pumilum]|uniref:Uncharacterized protein n=1 Tax=Microbacterium pumilum TaxID=344165 RepID=A0ABN2RTY6_9MICO